MTNKEILDLLSKKKSEGGINQIQISGIKREFPEVYEELLKISFPEGFSLKQKLYHYLNNDLELNLGKCKKCGNRCKFKSIQQGYHDYCCNSCAQSADIILKNRKMTCLKKYGDENYNNREKSVKTCLEKYGVENIQQVKEINEQSIRTKHRNYGDKCESITKKTKETKFKKYGNANYNNIEKNKKTCLEKYGVENVFAVEEVKEKIKNTNLERYGVEHPMKSTIILEHTKNTNLEKYNVEWCCMRKEARFGYSNDSKPNDKFAKLLDKNNIEYEREFPLHRFSYDFKIGNILVEIDPIGTHNSQFGIYGKNPISKDYHLNKTNLAKENGFHCIHVWDWDNVDKIIQMLKPKKTLYARKLEFKEVKLKDAVEFLNKYHLQNSCKGQKICLGLYHNNELVQLMTFGKPRYNKNFEWELLRLCSHSDYMIVGGAEKIFKHFVEDICPNGVVSYCDVSKFNGGVYETLGFEKHIAGPSKHWYRQSDNMHITDNLLRQRGYDQLFDANYGKGTSNEELMLEHDFLPIYDCGQTTYKYFIK